MKKFFTVHIEFLSLVNVLGVGGSCNSQVHTPRLDEAVVMNSPRKSEGAQPLIICCNRSHNDLCSILHLENSP